MRYATVYNGLPNFLSFHLILLLHGHEGRWTVMNEKGFQSRGFKSSCSSHSIHIEQVQANVQPKNHYQFVRQNNYYKL